MSKSYDQLYDEQVLLEVEAQDVKARKEYNDLTKAIEQGRFDETVYGNILMKTYFQPIRDKIKEYLDTDYQGHTGKTQRYIKYLCDDADKIAYVVIQTLLRTIAVNNNKIPSIRATVEAPKIFPHAITERDTGATKISLKNPYSLSHTIDKVEVIDITLILNPKMPG